MRLVIGITGASGVIYGIRLLEVLAATGKIETHLIISRAGELVIEQETDMKVDKVRSMATYSYDINDIGARLSSGSFKTDGMVIAPCTMKTLSALANSYSDNLLTRTGDVIMKEKRKLLLLVRETPFHLGHLRNMERICEMGAIIMPPLPGFYNRPKSVMDIVDYTVGRVLDILGIKHDIVKRWPGLE